MSQNLGKEGQGRGIKRKIPPDLVSPFSFLDWDLDHLAIDEVGRGPIAGPVCLGFVYFDQQTRKLIFDSKILQGLKDSKKLSPSKRESLFSEILKYAAFARVELASARFIDRFNINQAIFHCIWRGRCKFFGMYKKEMPIWIDGNYNLDKNIWGHSFGSYRSIKKGDELVPTISAASILAKVFRDRFMARKSKRFPEYGFERNSGYGTEFHREAIQKFGISYLHRKSFLHNLD